MLVEGSLSVCTLFVGDENKRPLGFSLWTISICPFPSQNVLTRSPMGKFHSTPAILGRAWSSRRLPLTCNVHSLHIVESRSACLSWQTWPEMEVYVHTEDLVSGELGTFKQAHSFLEHNPGWISLVKSWTSKYRLDHQEKATSLWRLPRPIFLRADSLYVYIQCAALSTRPVLMSTFAPFELDIPRQHRSI